LLFIFIYIFISLGIHKSREHNSRSKNCLSWKTDGGSSNPRR